MFLAIVIRRQEVYPDDFRAAVTDLVGALSDKSGEFGTIFSDGQDVSPAMKERGFTHAIYLDGRTPFGAEVLQNAEELWNLKM